MANKLILEKKAETVKTIASKISESAGVVFIDYRGLTDEEFTSLRKNLRENNADVKVYKNTLTKRALDSLNITLDECVVGPSALVYSTDAVSPIKVVTNFAKDHEALSVKGGLVDGKVTSLEELAELATIPSRDGLLTMFAAGLMEHVKNVAICLDLHSQNLEEE